MSVFFSFIFVFGGGMWKWTWTCGLVLNPQSDGSMDDSCFVLSPVDSAFVVPGLSPKPLSDKSSNPE